MSDFHRIDPAEQAARMAAAGQGALARWDIDGANLELLKYRENAVFKVESGTFRGALRLHRPGYHSDLELRSELQWMRALMADGIRVPEPVPTADGDWFVHQPVEGLDGAVQVDLFHWIDGSQLGSVEAGVDDESAVEQTFGQLGELAARVHNQASGWQPPAGFSRHAWDEHGLAGDGPLWGRFWELQAASAADRDLLERTRARVFDELAARPKEATGYSLIHADFAAENIMVGADGVRLIDFDDAGFGWHLFELATALYFIQGAPYFERARDALVAGYRRHRDLPDDELGALPLFMLARGTTYVGWVHTRSETETARELTPMLLGLVRDLAEDYLAR